MYKKVSSRYDQMWKKILLPLFIKYNLAKVMVMFYLQKGIHPGVYEVQFLADLTQTSFPLAWEYSSLLHKWSPRKCINSLLPDILNGLFINRQSHIFFISYWNTFLSHTSNKATFIILRHLVTILATALNNTDNLNDLLILKLFLNTITIVAHGNTNIL